MHARLKLLLATGLVAALASPAPAGFPVLENCNIISADSPFWVPTTIGTPARVDSGTGGYGYRPRCGSWVADIKLASYSNTVNGVPTPLKFWVGAYDLPSSSTTGGIVAANEEDCSRYFNNVRIYSKPSEASSFSALCGYQQQGSWSAATKTCTVVTVSSGGTCPTLLTPPAPNTTDWRTYRFVVRTTERTSTQQTSVVLFQPQQPLP